MLTESGVADRCTLLGGDFFESVPEGHDLYMMTMLTLLGSKVRTVKEFQHLLSQAGFELRRTVDLVHGFAILEARPS